MIDGIRSILVEDGYEVIDFDQSGILRIKDLDCGVVITCVLEQNIFFMSVFCKTVSMQDMNLKCAKQLLDTENGISTSFFNISATKDGKYIISLNNFCKLQELGEDDRDDILSCLGFLSVDLLCAREMLS